MKISHVLFLFLLAIHLIELPLLQATEVMWDNSKDIIYYEGKLYYPQNDGDDDSNNKITPNPKNQSSQNNKNNSTTENKENLPNNNHGNSNGQGHDSHGHEEEEFASGGKFWFCIFMIFSKFSYLLI
jgi:hypothetical protein